MGKNNRKDGQSPTIFSITERKTSIQNYTSLVRAMKKAVACKRMWKITSGVFIVFFLRIALKRPYNK